MAKREKSFMIGIDEGYKDGVRVNLDLAKEAGVDWIRLRVPFVMEGKPTKQFLQFKERVKEITNYGFKIMGNTVSPERVAGEPGIPKQAGEQGSPEFYETYQKSCRYTASELKENISYWLIGNELDAEYRGDLSIEEAIKFLQVGGKGVKEGNPEAKIGVNMCGFSADSYYMWGRLYYPDSSVEFDWVGTDGYFGSWHEGGPERWSVEIEKIHKLTSKPVIVTEFGYSSGGGEVATEEERRSGGGLHRLKKWSLVWGEGHNPTVQAKYIERVMEVFSKIPSCLIGIFYFCWSDLEACDECKEKDCPIETKFGLLDAEGNLKLSYEAFKKTVKNFFG